MRKLLINLLVVILVGFIIGWTFAEVLRAQAPAPFRLIAKITLETQPAPTGTIRHWSLEGTGGVCSADLASPFGKLMLENEGRRLITFEAFDIGIGRVAQ
jgi:hypothetical protein